jgi:DNA-binding MarR family transcriptional regulator
MYDTYMNDIAHGQIAGVLTVLHAAGVAESHVESKLAEVGLSLAKLAALNALREAGESLPLSQLAARLSCVKSNITQLVDRLEADGLVSRAADPHDRRARLAVMTPAGRQACEVGMRIHQEAEQVLLSGLSIAERLQLSELMAKLEKAAR